MEKYTFVTRPDDISRGIQNRIDLDLAHTEGFIRDDEHPETVIVIGGDGTFIYAVHQYIDRLDEVRFYGIHTGTLGFYTDYRDCELAEFVTAFKKGEYRIKTYPMLRCEDTYGKVTYAINEIRVENAARTQTLNVYINGEYLETFRGTGMCICTQLGSTAYNRSLGGAVIQEGLNLIELAEIAGIHHSRYRSLEAPLILKGDSVIELKAETFNGALLGYDADVYPLNDVDSLEIKVCAVREVKVMSTKNISYFDRLKSLY